MFLGRLKEKAVAEAKGAGLHDTGAGEDALKGIKSSLVGKVGSLKGEFPAGGVGGLVAVAENDIGEGARADAGGVGGEVNVRKKIGKVGVSGDFGGV